MGRAKVAESGLNVKVLIEMIEELQKKVELHSITVIYKGDTVLEAAWAPFTLNDPQMMHSLSKIGTSISLGFAVNEGKIRLEDHFIDYVREDLPEKYDPALEAITIYDLLTMQAGSPECCNNVWFSRLEKSWETEWLKESKIKEDIGNVFHYDSGCSYTLSRIVTKVMGKTCLEIMSERIFDKLGIGKVNWLKSPEGHNTGGWGMYLTSGKIAALADLIIKKGRYDGEQLISEKWINEMTKCRVAVPGAEKAALSHYAYHIKAGDEIFAAEGAFGQYLIGFRNYPVAIGITAGTPDYVAADICLKYMKKAIDGEQLTLNENKEAEEKLDALIDSLSLPLPEGEIADLPKKICGKLITFSENPRKINSLMLKQIGERLYLKIIIDGEEKEAYAGYKKSVRNVLYPGDFTKEVHALSYAFGNETLEIKAGLINTSYYETYRLTFNYGGIKVTWKPNVTYLDQPDDGIWFFDGKISEDSDSEK